MLSVYLEDKRVSSVPFVDLPSDAVELQRYILNTLSSSVYQYVDIYDINGHHLVEGQLEPAWLSYVVVSGSSEEAAKWRPIKITIRRTDKIGYILFKHPTTTVYELQRSIESLTRVPPKQQVLMYNNQLIGNDGTTLAEAGLRELSMVHLIDLRKWSTSFEEEFVINIQQAQSGCSCQLMISAGLSVMQLKDCVSQIFGLAPQDLSLVYSGMVLVREEALLMEYLLIPNAFVTVVYCRNPTAEVTASQATDQPGIGLFQTIQPFLKEHIENSPSNAMITEHLKASEKPELLATNTSATETGKENKPMMLTIKPFSIDSRVSTSRSASSEVVLTNRQ